jgi:hypothetical protein
MLVGYNTNVPYKGKLYHVQTEDNGTRNPVIVTLLYIKGTILASKRTSYAHLASDPRCKDAVREMMKEQHKNMIKELVRGVHTGEEKPEPAEKKEGAEQEEEAPAEEPGPKKQIVKSLDDILIDHIIKSGE